MAPILLKNGTVLVHNNFHRVKAIKAIDILVDGGLIKEIAQNITAEGADVLDCTSKIISPGFIDTHHHLWQTQLKGSHAEHTLLDYFPAGNTQSHNFSPDDVYWGQLAGAMEAIDAGTTLVLDHAHICQSREHATKALAATCASGIRSIFAYGIPTRFDRWDSEACIPNQDLLPQDLIQQCEELATSGLHGQGRVEIGFGFDFYFLPKPMVKGLFERLRAAGVKVFTSHVVKNAVFGLGSIIRNLRDCDLITSPPDIVLSHCTGLDEEEKNILIETQIPISSTADTEAQMGMGWPLAFTPGINYTFGVDCHTNNTSSIISLGRSALQMARQQSNLKVLEKGGFPQTLRSTTEEAFNAATISAARSLGLESKTGSLKVGKRADLVIFNTSCSPAMAVPGDADPLVAVFRHSSIADIEAVMVDGIWRKKDFKLCPISVSESASPSIEWSDVRQNLLRSRAEILKRQEKAPIPTAVKTIRQLYYVDESKLLSIDT